MLDLSQADAAIFRTAVAAFTYYPAKTEREPGYTVDEDLNWCIRPLRNLPQQEHDQLAKHIRQLIIDPTADRQSFIRHLRSLTGEPNPNDDLAEP
ncbi:MAG TPA: hypothetical protein PK781_01580 [Terrimesophilobacter sp.]|nr:hypothetical protein [Terrimesophilobacter sp.]HRP99132.1 hypothetical protein [Terrimesophilobacter sp.]